MCPAGCLATYISDVLELEQEFLASLPWVWKAPLLAVARRKVTVLKNCCISMHKHSSYGNSVRSGL